MAVRARGVQRWEVGVHGIDKACVFWVQGKCNRNPCRFMHIDSPKPNFVYRRDPETKTLESNDESTLRAILLKKRQLMIDSSSSGESKTKLLSLSSSSEESSQASTGGFSMLAKLECGPDKVIAGIALPSGSERLYSCTTDGTAQVWDCHTGQCTSTQPLGNPVGSSICEGTWVFIATLNAVLAWDSRSDTSFQLKGSSGQVHAMFFKNDTLFAGDEEGVILAWKHTSSEPNPFQPSTSYRGHTSRVTCLAADDNTLYSASADHTVRAWNLQTSMCVTLIGHTDAVTSLVCWNGTVLSGSLDKTIRAWAYGQHNLEVVYNHQEEHGVIALSVMHDAQENSILLCSCNDNAVHLFDLPSFNERGRLFSRAPVHVIHNQMDLVFTGDRTGSLIVWKWVGTT